MIRVGRRQFLKTSLYGAGGFASLRAAAARTISGHSAQNAPLRVALDSTKGAPRILVNGKPVRARMLFGNPGSRPFELGLETQQHGFDFEPFEDSSDSTLRLDFTETLGEVFVDGFEVFDLDRQEVRSEPLAPSPSEFRSNWSMLPPPTRAQGVAPANIELLNDLEHEGTKTLHVDARNATANAMASFRIQCRQTISLFRSHRYRASFWARTTGSCHLAVTFISSTPPHNFVGGNDGFESEIKLAGQAGAPFVSFSVNPPWNQSDSATPDWTWLDDECERILRKNPDVLLIPRIGLAPSALWIDKHPDELVVWDHSEDSGSATTPSVSSAVYRRDATAQLEAAVLHLENKFGNHVAGYHPVGQHTGEWFYPGIWRSALSGYGKSDLAAWRIWLSKRYVTDTALQTAWNRRDMTARSAEIPVPELRRATPGGIFLDLHSQRSVCDFALFQQEMMADCVCELASVARRASRGKKLILFFYGYEFEFGTVHNGPATSGHYALRQILRSPDIDIVCAPLSYFDRGLGGSAPVMTPAESITLAGKMYLAEDDTFTYLAEGTFPGYQDGLKNLKDTQQTMLRNTAECAMRNFATWWMDLGATGWFDDSRLWEEMAQLGKLDDSLIEHPRQFRPEIAAVIDSASMLRVGFGGDSVTAPAIGRVRASLGRIGAPYGQYLLNDVLAGKVEARLYVFLNAWCLSEFQRHKLLEVTAEAACIWCYAPGYLDGDAPSIEAMHQLTGFQFREVTGMDAWADATSLGRQWSLPSFGVRKAIRPLFAVAHAAPQETFAAYSDGSAAVAVRKTGSHTSIFAGPPGPPVELLRAAARLANVHLYTKLNAVVYANGPYVAIHALEDGPLEVNIGKQLPVRNLLTGSIEAVGPVISLAVQKGDTRIFEILVCA